MKFLCVVPTKTGIGYARFDSEKLVQPGKLSLNGHSIEQKKLLSQTKLLRLCNNYSLETALYVAHPSAFSETTTPSLYQQLIRHCRKTLWSIVGQHACFSVVGYPYRKGRSTRQIIDYVNIRFDQNLKSCDGLAAQAIMCGNWYSRKPAGQLFASDAVRQMTSLSNQIYWKIRVD